ncbi:hypothetical protein CBER1_07190 [Cercospora berteroae]|uniref:Uncharacterized protein n=1 Tax=Cercospora berteroae TaxID=357750 RepID=A0A2S6BRY1_9PEZI|nr:hypothetical protein CBER1_07190 [Cercospora berteroae]
MYMFSLKHDTSRRLWRRAPALINLQSINALLHQTLIDTENRAARSLWGRRPGPDDLNFENTFLAERGLGVEDGTADGSVGVDEARTDPVPEASVFVTLVHIVFPANQGPSKSFKLQSRLCSSQQSSAYYPLLTPTRAEPGTKNPDRWSSAVNDQVKAMKCQTKEFVEANVERARARNSRSKDLDTTMNDPALSAEQKEREASALRKSERDTLRFLRKTA